MIEPIVLMNSFDFKFSQFFKISNNEFHNDLCKISTLSNSKSLKGLK